MRSLYQDRLGTNIGKALKNRLPFSQDWNKEYSEWEGWQDSARLNLAINSLMPLLNGPAATRRCVPMVARAHVDMVTAEAMFGTKAKAE